MSQPVVARTVALEALKGLRDAERAKQDALAAAIIEPVEDSIVETSPAQAAMPMQLGQPIALTRIGKGPPVSNASNATIATAQIFGSRLYYDEFHEKIFIADASGAAREWSDTDAMSLQLKLQRDVKLINCSLASVQTAITVLAKRHTRNCVADWLNGLRWDGVRRLSLVFPLGWGTRSNRYYIRAGRNFLLGMVARALNPACQLDTMPVFEGAQGIFKSSALKVLAGDWFAEVGAAFESKDFLIDLGGVWLAEVAELASMKKADIEKIKAIITTTTRRFRAPYARTTETHPRRGVFAGTTNAEQYLADDTGNRRFIPVQCGRIDLAYLRMHREQLFAEAVALIKAGRKWWVMPRQSTADMQSSRLAADPWGEQIRRYLANNTLTEVTSHELMNAVGVVAANQTRGTQTRIGVAMKNFPKWVKRQRYETRERYWARSVP